MRAALITTLLILLTACGDTDPYMVDLAEVDYSYETIEKLPPNQPNTLCTKTCPQVAGKTPKAVHINPLSIWINVSIDGNKFADIPRTWQDNEIYYYFNDTRSFAESFGYDKKKRLLTKAWYLLAEFEQTDETCIHPTQEHKMPATDAQWLCTKNEII